MSQIHYGAINTAISPIETSVISFADQNSKPILEIGRDGKIIIGEGYTPTEAADEFIRILTEKMPQYIDSPYKAEIKALRNDVKRLEEDKEIYKRQFRSIQIQLEAWVEDYHRLQNEPFS
jgi:hypothetical protein